MKRTPIRLFAIVSVGLAAGCNSPATRVHPSVTADAAYHDRQYVIEAQTESGRHIPLVIGSLAFQSGTSIRHLVDRTIEIRVNGTKIARAHFRRDNWLPGDAYLGMETLARMAVGFDLSFRTVTLFPDGGLSDGEAKGWVGGGPGVPGRARAQVISIPMALEAWSFPVITLTVNKTNYRAMLATEMYVSYVGGEPVSDEPGLQFFPNARIGPQTIPWFGSYQTKSEADHLSETPFNAMISLDNLGSDRVLLDFAGRRLYVTRGSPDEQLSDFLSSVSACWYEINGSTIRLRDYRYTGRPQQGLGGSRVLRIGTKSAAEVLDLLRSNDPGSRSALEVFLRLLRYGYRVSVTGPDGKPREFDVARAKRNTTLVPRPETSNGK